MKNLLVLIITLVAGIFLPVSAQNLNYRIIQDGSEMMIIPTYDSNYQPTRQIRKPILEVNSAPAKIPYYYSERTLPKAKNKTRSV